MNEIKSLSFSNVIIKSMLSLIVAIFAALFVISNIGPIFVGWTGLFLVFLFGFLWRMDMKFLKEANNLIVRLITFTLGSIMLGMFFGNALIVTVYYVEVFAGDVSGIISTAIIYASFGTAVATIGGIILAPRMASKQRLGVPAKLVRAVFMMLAGYAIVSLGAFVFALLGFEGLWIFIVRAVFGLGPISIMFSILMVLVASYLLISIIAHVYGVVEESKTVQYQNVDSLEYFYGLIIANSIIDLFVELFRLSLKLLSIANK